MFKAITWDIWVDRAQQLRADGRLWLIAMWLVLQSLDIATTAFGLRNGLREANGIAAFGFAQHGELSVYGFKGLVALAILGSIVLLQPRFPRLWLGLQIITGYMLLAVSFNVLNIILEA